MATVLELSDPYTHFMLSPPTAGPGVCRHCHTFCTPPYDRCRQCAYEPVYCEAAMPISMSVAFGQLHAVLRQYKGRASSSGPVRRTQFELAAVLWRFLERHETCLASACGVESFSVVTVVPSSSAARDASHPLRWIVGSAVASTAARYRPLLRRSSTEVFERRVDVAKYDCESLNGEPVLLIDDTWTSGASIQSAAGSMRLAGSGPVGALVAGRHISAAYGDNEKRLNGLPRPFNWDWCVHH